MILKGNLIAAPKLGGLTVLPGGYLVLDDAGTIQGVYGEAQPFFQGQTVCDFGDKLILQSFADLHLHAPQYPMLGMGMDLPLLEWLNTYTFRMEAYFCLLYTSPRIWNTGASAADSALMAPEARSIWTAVSSMTNAGTMDSRIRSPFWPPSSRAE